MDKSQNRYVRKILHSSIRLNFNLGFKGMKINAIGGYFNEK
jgi:hypothetical protein